MALTQEEYEKLRSDVIQKYKVVYKDSVAMDACKVPKDVRIRMLDDSEYIAETKAIKAFLLLEKNFVISFLGTTVVVGELKELPL